MSGDLSGMDVGGAAVGGAGVLLVVLGVAVIALATRYRRENVQLRTRNVTLSMENDRWHEDFAAATGELSALRGGHQAHCADRVRTRAEAS